MTLTRLFRSPRFRVGVLALWVPAAVGGLAVERATAQRAIAPVVTIDEVARPSTVLSGEWQRVIEPRAGKSSAVVDLGLGSAVRADFGAARGQSTIDTQDRRPLPPRRARFTYQATAPPRAL